jgi:hypothetical protein
MTITRFAWLPTKLSNGSFVWLTRYCQTNLPDHLSHLRANRTNPSVVYRATLDDNRQRCAEQQMIHNRNIWNDPLLTKQDRA